MRRVLFLTGAIVFVDTLFFAALTPLLPQYADRFDLTKAGAGLLAAAYPLGVLVGGIPSGYLAARVGVKPTAVTALCLIAVTSVASGTATRFRCSTPPASRRGSAAPVPGRRPSRGWCPWRRAAGEVG